MGRADGLFAPPDSSRAPAPLAHAKISRTTLSLAAESDGRVAIEAPARLNLRVNGSSLHGTRVFDRAALASGVILQLGRHAAFVLHEVTLAPARTDHGLTGRSLAVDALRAQIDRVADLSVPVLLLGETGVGKERVAQAIHAAGGGEGPLIAVNVATLGGALAPTELFGHERGAFTGATSARAGLFAEADGGTLFLDEIGELDSTVQPMLLRVLETSQVRAVGGASTRQVNVRVLAATDVDLEAQVTAGEFRAPLYHRLRGFELRVPALRERRADLPALMLELLRETLKETGEQARLQGEGEKRWIQPELLGRLARHDWPGNVRQLRGVLRQIAVASRGAPSLLADAAVERSLEVAPPLASESQELTSTAVLAALHRSEHSLSRAARELGVSRSRLYRFVEAHPDIRTGADLTTDEIARAHTQYAGHLESMASALRVSARALRLRMTALKMTDR